MGLKSPNRRLLDVISQPRAELTRKSFYFRYLITFLKQGDFGRQNDHDLGTRIKEASVSDSRWEDPSWDIRIDGDVDDWHAGGGCQGYQCSKQIRGSGNAPDYPRGQYYLSGPD